MKILALIVLMCAGAGVAAADLPYNEAADAKAEVKQALAAGGDKPVIIVFGANWCPDCRILDIAMKRGASAALLARDFKIVKVDVGHLDKNVDLADSCGVPLKKGIPAVAIFSPKDEVLYVTKEGELADPRKMGEDGIYQFFKRVTTGVEEKRKAETKSTAGE